MQYLAWVLNLLHYLVLILIIIPLNKGFNWSIATQIMVVLITQPLNKGFNWSIATQIMAAQYSAKSGV